MSKGVIGIDLGGTNVKAALVSVDGQVLEKVSLPTHADEGLEKVLSVMQGSVENLLQKTGVSRADVLAMGIGAPGPMNWQTGVVYSPPNLPGWKDVPLADLMAERTGIKTYVDNDANVACWGEFWLGAGRNVHSMCALTLGTGLGGGIVVFGKLLRGIDGTAAEIGHLCVQRDGRECGCGAKGCIEQYASVTGMVRTAVEGLKAGRQSRLTGMCGGDPNAITGKLISDAHAAGDEFAGWVLHETGVWLGTACASLINLLNPEMIVLCGGGIAAGEPLFKPTRETALAQSFEVPGRRCQIVPAGLGNDAGVIGCAGCALERYREENGVA
ncbi:MAG: sugar kinase [Candidatus Hydrogenedentota bacterium]